MTNNSNKVPSKLRVFITCRLVNRLKHCRMTIAVAWQRRRRLDTSGDPTTCGVDKGETGTRVDIWCRSGKFRNMREAIANKNDTTWQLV
jgi:hypothetical protein